MFLQAGVYGGSGAGGFDVEDDVAGFEEGGDVEVGEFAVGYRRNAGVELSPVVADIVVGGAFPSLVSADGAHLHG